MADTLLAVVQETLRATQQRTQSAFSDSNDTNFIVDRINDALDKVYSLKGPEIDVDGSTTITASTRTFAGPTGLDLSRIYDWSFRINNAAGDIPVEAVTKEYIVENYPLFESEEADVPQFVYIDGITLAVYPLLTTGASSLTLQYIYPANLTKLTLVTDVLPFKDRSSEMSYIKLFAKYKYEVFKGLGQPMDTFQDMDNVWATLVAKQARLKKQGFTGYRRYGQ
jgi:hypothetical protein